MNTILAGVRPDEWTATRDALTARPLIASMLDKAIAVIGTEDDTTIVVQAGTDPKPLERNAALISEALGFNGPLYALPADDYSRVRQVVAWGLDRFAEYIAEGDLDEASLVASVVFAVRDEAKARVREDA